MPLSDNSESIPPVSETDTNDDSQESRGASAKRPGGTLIERLDAFYEHNESQRSPLGRPRKATTAEGLPSQKVARQELPKKGDERQAKAKLPGTRQEPAGQEQELASTKAGSHPSDRSKNGYTQVSVNLNYGQATSKRRTAERKDAVAKGSGKSNKSTNASNTLTSPAANATKARSSGQTERNQRDRPTAQSEPASPNNASTRPTPSNKDGNPKIERGVDSGSSEEKTAAEGLTTADVASAASDGIPRDQQPGKRQAQELAEESTPNIEVTGEIALKDEPSGELDSKPPREGIRGPASPPPPTHDEMHYARYGRSIFLGMLLLIVGVGGFLTWASLAPISSGVVASGIVKLQGERKTVQHLEGGLIEKLLVIEGQAVKEGQVLVLLDGSKAEALLDVQSAEYAALVARSDRLNSERRKLDEYRILTGAA